MTDFFFLSHPAIGEWLFLGKHTERKTLHKQRGTQEAES